ncbi:MAG TPA: DUF72 domain-containing protein [Flexivirga sp.]|uniref:DUF72 domain-containing protein n=1 Tax=Flexivirga sp. TaxID=1962927 RepID=UPI002BC599DF|nr:DUF72 domain-containing protein [Flexivirga sp.]HWC22213.1 DUF72 domain-containing protein [Flexivirga sp.]
MSSFFVGTSGWSYPTWRGDFYPPGLVHRRELEYLSHRTTSAEINGSFYSLQRPSSYAAWRDQTPDDFVFAVKGGRFITHLKRLHDVGPALANFFASGVLALPPQLGPILWQLPARQPYDADLLEAFFSLLPRDTTQAERLAQQHDDKIKESRTLTRATSYTPLRHALEPRHDSFLEPEAADLLRRHDIAMVLSDSAGRWPVIDRDTAGFRYVRLHGDTELYTSGYSPEALDRWTARCRTWSAAGQDVYVYFDNDAKGYAPHDAVGLLARLTESAH